MLVGMNFRVIEDWGQTQFWEMTQWSGGCVPTDVPVSLLQV